MGLINCKRCGNQISDRAARCPKCGLEYHQELDSNVSLKLTTCPQCGKKISKRAKACPNCGYGDSNNNIAEEISLEQLLQKRSVQIYLLGFIAIILLIGYLSFAQSTKEPLLSAAETITSNEKKGKGDNNTSWLIGVWEYTDESSTSLLEITESKATLFDGYDTEERSYEIDGNKLRMLCPNSINITFDLDFTNQRIDMGRGHWMHKTNKRSVEKVTHSSSFPFRHEQDIILYMMNKQFCKNGNCITVRDMCLYTNGTCATGAIKVVSFNDEQAILEAYSPLLGGRLRFSVDKKREKLIDLNSGDVYFSN